MLLALFAGLAACGDDGGSGSKSAYCKALDDAAKEAAATTTSVAGPSTTTDFKDIQKKFNVAFDKIADKAPDELKDDYKVVDDYFTLYLSARAGEPGADTKKLQAMGPQYSTAQQAIAKYNKDTCDFEVTTTVPASSATTAKS